MTPSVFHVTPNGAAIRAIREARGTSLRAIAREAGIAPGYLAQIERGERRPRHAKVDRIAQALGVPVEAIDSEGNVTTAIDSDADLRLYDAQQVADLWGISKSWLQKAAASRSIECTYLQLPGNSKGLLRFSEAQVRQIFAGFTVQPINGNGRKSPKSAA
jgi:transcriptional regulator with XRE-family HTH domain